MFRVNLFTPQALVCGEEQLSLWMTVQLDGGRHPTQQRVGVTQMNPANILAGVTLPPILLNLVRINNVRFNCVH